MNDDLETKLAEARRKAQLKSNRNLRKVVAEKDADFIRMTRERNSYKKTAETYAQQAGEAADLLAEKDAEIARLKDDIDGLLDGSYPTRKVSDAQRKAIYATIMDETDCSFSSARAAAALVCAILESTGEPAAK